MIAGSETKTVLRNVAFLAASQVISQSTMAITAIVLINYLGLSMYSQYATAMGFMSFFSVFSNLGFNRLFLRDCSKNINKTPQYFGTNLVFNTILSIIIFFIAVSISYYRYDKTVFTLSIILGLSLVIQGLRM